MARRSNAEIAAQKAVNSFCKTMLGFLGNVEKELRLCKRVELAEQLSELIEQGKSAVRQHDSEVVRQFQRPRKTN